MGYYAVTATVERKQTDRWSRTVQVPTFYLHSDVQGIRSEEDAIRVAKSVLNPFRDDNIVVHVYATETP